MTINSLLTEFESLFKEFNLGTDSLNYQMKKNGKTPFFWKEVERFRKRIEEPMDAAWLRLSPEEQEEWWAHFRATRKRRK